MQVFKTALSSNESMTIVCGFIGSILFMLLLTCVGNAETLLFGRGFQTKLPEVFACILLAAVASGFVHRVSFTTCVLFSLIELFWINRVSATTYGSAQPAKTAAPAPRRKK